MARMFSSFFMTSVHECPCEKASSMTAALLPMVSTDVSASCSISCFSSSRRSLLKSPRLMRSTCCRQALMAFCFLPKGSFGTAASSWMPASLKAVRAAMPASTLCSFMSESSSPALPLVSRPLARSSTSASGSKSVGAVCTCAMILMSGMGSLMPTCSFFVMAGIDDTARSGTGPVCTRPKVSSSRGSKLSASMSPQSSRPMFGAT